MNDKTLIMGNPPFYGAYLLSEEQRSDTEFIWQGANVGGRLDFVANWYVLAARQIAQHGGRAAFVSTNSIAQGVQPPTLWRELNKSDIEIDFAHQTFKWQNDASGMAAVHVVIIGFSRRSTSKKDKNLWTYSDIKGSPKQRIVKRINPYLIDAPEVLLETRSKPLKSETPVMVYGSKPTDGGFLSDLSPEEAAVIRATDPTAAKYLRRIIGGRELIHNTERWCLWLKDLMPNEARQSKVISNRLEQVREMRRASKKLATRELSNSPHLFETLSHPDTSYIAVPLITSENRDYLTVSLMDSDVVGNNKIGIIPNGDLVIFAMLSNRVFTVWNKSVSGRLKSDLNVSITLTYNNFPFVSLNELQRTSLSTYAKSIVDARAKFVDSSLADLYDPLIMPTELRKAHEILDREILSLYGLKSEATDAEILETLFGMYVDQVSSEPIKLPKRPKVFSE